MATYTNTLLGTATIFGLDGLTVIWTGQAKYIPNSANFSDSPNEVTAEDEGGQTFAVAFTKNMHSLSIEVVRVLATSSPATTRDGNRGELKVPPAGTVIALAGFGNNLFDGNWNYPGGASISASNNGFLRMTLPLKRYGATPASMTAVS